MTFTEIINVRGKRLGFFEAWCKACGICIALCPKQVFDTGRDGKPQVSRPEACVNCGTCEIMCPDFAIGWYEDPLHDEEFLHEGRNSGKAAPPATTPSPAQEVPNKTVSPKTHPKK